MDQDPEAIKRDMDETRARMGETVEALAYKTDVPARAKDAVNDRVEGIKGAISGVVDSAKGALGGATASAQAATAKTADAVGSVQSSATDAVTQARARLPSGVAATERFNGVRSLAERNPLGLGIGAIAAGFLIGLVLPVSDIERDQVGPLGEQMVGGAKAAADEAIEHGKATITQALGDALQGKATPTS
jgi:hypothetical protein